MADGEEVTQVHSHLLRVTLEVEHARAYWAQARPELSLEAEAALAFAEYWFGAKSMARVQTLLRAFRLRFDAYPQALAVLRQWPRIDRDCRTAICHWHVQLTDPLYRRFTGDFLAQRRLRRGEVGREAVLSWIEAVDQPQRWNTATRVGFASKLMSVAHAAGIITSTRDPRPLTVPKVPAAALAYLLYLLRSIRFAGSLLDNPYLRSVGLDGDLLEDLLRRSSGVGLHRVGDVFELQWRHPDLGAWAADTLERAS
ncbi:MAG: DUF1819 domain-containing protein [Nannocystaceae bacterium]